MLYEVSISSLQNWQEILKGDFENSIFSFAILFFKTGCQANIIDDWYGIFLFDFLYDSMKL